MPFATAQSALKKLLPQRWFALLYGLASSSYRVWQRVSNKIYLLCSYAYYVLKGDLKNARGIKMIQTILPYTMIGRTGLLATYDIASEVEKKGIEGCFVECGVARGGCSALMAMLVNDNNSGRKVWLFDSFEGLPSPTAEDDYEEPIISMPTNKSASIVSRGYCLGTYDEVEELLFSKLGLNRDNVYMERGWFQDTLPKCKDKIGAIAILRIDGDWYESTKCCLDNLYDNVVTGGYIIIDDYWSVTGCKKATDDFLKKRELNMNLTFDDRGGVYFIKS
ncbi:TylF/MycF/NovP-related O-methyltransferase [Chloroflexota bacterium]